MDEAVVEVMEAFVVIKSILSTIETAVIESGLVAGDAESHCLSSPLSNLWIWSSILNKHINEFKKTSKFYVYI